MSDAEDARAAELRARLAARSQRVAGRRAGLSEDRRALLARLVQGQEEGSPSAVAIPRRREEGPPALSFAQERLWFLDQLYPASAAYNLPSAVRLSGRLDPAALQAALSEIVRRHETLRTTFAQRGDRPAQIIHGPREVFLPVVDLSGLAGSAEEVRRLALAEAARPFALTTDPMMRGVLLSLGPAEHVVFLTQHHIVSDAWSVGILIRELGILYEALAQGRPSPLPELPIQYADFAAWQRTWLAGEELERQLSYWRRQLAGAPTVLELPTDRPRPPRPSERGAVSARTLPPSFATALGAFALERNATLFMVLFAGLSALLLRLTGESTLLLGSVVANRTRREVEGLIGFFVNTLVLRADLPPRESFHSFVEQARETALAAFAHQDLPFEKLVAALAPEREASRAPLFQVMLAVQNAPFETLEITGLTLEQVRSGWESAKFDLTLNVFETPQGLLASWLYSPDLFDRTTIERLLGRFEGLLQGALREPDLPIRELPWLLPGEREQLLREWNDTWSEYPREASLDALFADWVELAPEASAVIGKGEEWSYGRLDEAANRLAWHLRSLGVRPESRVGVAMERSPDLIVALLGILKAGGVYVPLDPGYPDERLRFMLEDTEASVVLVHGRTRERLAGLASSAISPWQLVCLDGDREAIAGWSRRRMSSPVERASAAELAIVLYTSGSTGRPKGVAISHRAIVRLVRGTNYARLGPGDRLAHASNISFDAATFEIWGALLNGGAVVVIGKDVALSPSSLARTVREERVTVLFLTTALFNQMAREEPAAFRALRRLLFGGEAADPGAVARALAEGEPERLLHVYGPTESTTYATWHRVSAVEPGAATVPIGLPIANTTVYVSDPWQGLSGVGEVGELYIGGEGLARGYLNRPELTAERFVPDPWSAAPGERLYRTGDLVRRRGDGALSFVGRTDLQVKIRGFRIELQEIEAALAGLPGVEESVVLARQDGSPGGRRLVAYVVAAEEGLPERDLRAALKRSLPEYMLPSAYVFLPALPLTPNGKVDRAALPAPGGLGNEGYVAPRDQVEEVLAGIWEEVLGRKRVGVADDFFALGGHSLLATQVMSRVRGAFQVELPLRRLFEGATVAELARAVAEARRGGTKPTAPPILPAPRRGDLPLSFAQQRLWFIDQLEPGNPGYNVPLATRLTGEIEVDLLRRIFAEVVRRHEALRTTFPGTAGAEGPVQRVRESLPMALPVVSLERLPEAARDVEARRLAAAEARRPFDLAAGPLLRLNLLRLSAAAGREHVLLVTMHHIVSDGWSLGVLLREIGALYGAFSRGEASRLAELPVQYADFAFWQRGWLSGEVLEQQLSYWREELAGAPRELELATDRPRPLASGHRAGLAPVVLPDVLAADLAAFCRREGVTPFMALLAVYGVLLGRSANQPEVLIGTPIANRTRRETEGLIGFFVNTLVLRIPLGSSASTAGFRALLGRVRRAALDAYAHQDLPFERLVEEVVAERQLNRSPLFQAVFAFQNAWVEPLQVPGLSLVPLASPSGVAKFDLTLTLQESAAGLGGLLEYDAGLFDRTTAERLVGRFALLLRGALVEPDLPVWDLPLLLPGEREQLLREWNDTWSAYPREASVDGLFSHWAQTTLEAPAVIEEGEIWSYGRLAEASGRLAAYLLSRGVGRGARVGISIERSADLVVGLLAILRVGGAYVPLDPGYPDERLRFMLADTATEVVLVHGRTRERLAGLTGGWICLDANREEIARSPAPGPGPGLASAVDLAYVLYTSGSTGRPKGVAVPHRAIVRLVQGTNYAQLGPEDRVAHVSNISFDAATFEIWGALLNGGAVVVIDREVVLSPARFAARLRASGVTAMFLTAALFNQTVRELPEAFASVRHLLVGGEALDPVSIVRALTSGAPERLLNGYGPTESTTFAVWHRIDEIDPAATTVPIGLPLANTAVYGLDRWQGLAGLGAVGELHIGGEGLAWGYLNRPELTAERFVPHPWSAAPGERLYRTGDLARRRRDGTIEFLGRLDHQVKIRGFRIELGEIEAALAGLPGVGESVVLALPTGQDGRGDLRLVACLVAAPGFRLEEGELRAALKRSLPEYMLPSVYRFLEALPLTANGKLDRAALSAMSAISAAREGGEEGGYIAPRDPVEGMLAGIWAEVLGRERVGMEDDFFALGGHSLLATQVMSRVRGAFGVELALRQLFEGPTVAELGRAVAAARREGTGAQAPPILPLEAASRHLDLPLSFAQRRLWFIDQLAPGNPAYNVPLAVALTGEIEVSLLRRIFAEVVRRHEALRTIFLSSLQGPVQRVEEALPVSLPLVSLERLPAKARQSEAWRLAAAEARRSFDLAAGPLLRLTLLRFAGAEHLLLVTMHHIVSDGWSMGVLLREIGALYRAFTEGEGSPLPELPIQYADFAVWQREWLSGEVLGRLLAYWRADLAGAPNQLELPTDRPRPAVPHAAGARAGVLPVALPADLSRDLAALSRELGVTPFMTLLAALAVLLGRTANQEDVVVGTPIANRNHHEIEGMIGFFVNTLALRVPLDRRPSSRALLARVRQVALDAYAHQELPFERLVEEVVTDRSGSHPPLFQVMFALQNAPIEPLVVRGLSIRPLAQEVGTAKFDLSLGFQETEAGLSGSVEYDAGLFDRTTLERLLGRFAGLLGGMVREPDRAVWELPFLLPGEQQQLALEWNDSWSEYPREASLTALFAGWARARPAAPAVVEAEEEWSYGRVEAAANRLAWHLRSLGVGAESRVGVSMERSADLIVALLGILKAGGTYVTLDPGYPDLRLTFMLEDSAAEVVLVHRRTRERLESLASPAAAPSWRLVCLDEEREAIGGWSAEPASGQILAAELAHVIYTSGSTGRPKGVAIPHRAIVRLVQGTNFVRLRPEDRMAHVSNISFDAATYEIWGALLNGGALVVIGKETALSPAALARHLREQRVTVMVLATALFHQVVREEPRAFHGLRHLLIGGEALDPVAVARALAAGPPGQLINGYGPAEGTTAATWHEAKESPPGASTVPIGRPLANSAVHLLDPRGELAALGQVGEVYVGGEGLARGYLNRPELTAERFVPHPWSAEPGERLYRTGDLARRRADGVLEFVGRSDHQVKIRGFRIEPGEVEAVLAGLPGVEACAVLARRDTPGGARLVAYVVARSREPGEPLREVGVRAYLQRLLPEYMVPTAYLFLPALPLTPNGKLDRAALPAPERRGEEDAYIAPRSPVESLLAAIWEEVLARERVGVEDDFFALGGHSLLATQVVSRVRQAFGVELPLGVLFERTTIAGLAAEIDLLLRGGGESGVPALVPVPRDAPLPLSFAQQRLWFIDQLEPGSAAYNLASVHGASGPLDASALARSFTGLVVRHETLRTVFVRGADGPVERIGAPWEVPLPRVDLRALGAAERGAEALRLSREEGGWPFDLAAGPLLRTALLRLDAEEHILLVTLHHIVADGWSAAVLLREVAALYEAFRQGLPSPLPPLPIQYADFAAWQRRWLSGPVLEAELAYWRERLAGAPPVLDLPTDRPRPPVQSFRGSSHPFLFPEDLSAALMSYSRRQGVTPFILLLGAFETLLHRYTGATDLSLGMPIAGRNRLETEGLIGFFVNTLVLRSDLAGNPGFGALLSRLRGVVLAAYAHQDLPFEMLVEALQPKRSLSYEPLFQVVTDFHNRLPAAASGFSGLTWSALAGGEQRAVHFDLTLTGEEGEGLGGRLEYRTDLFDGTTIGRMVEHLRVLLAAVSAGEDSVLSELPLLAAGERHQLLAEGNAGGRFAVDLLHQRFAAQAERLPAEPAVVSGVEALTYRDLDRRTNRLAHALLRLGVGPEVVVGICLERSPELVVAVLAVLKAGGAYLPLDPAYPRERLAYMLGDSGARVIVTEERSAGAVPASDAHLLRLDAAELAAESDGPVASPVVPENLAYVIYTSGSTGRPRGVLVTHGNVSRLLTATEPWFGFGEKDVWTLFHSYAFDFSVWEIWGALAYGGRLVVVPYWVSRSPESFYELLVEEGVTVLNQTPSAFRQLIATEAAVGVSPRLALRWVIFGGEALDLPSLSPWVERHGAARPRLVNMYGITETTVHVTYRPLAAFEVTGGAGSVIGEAIPDLALHVLGPDLALQPIGAPGELCIGGAGLARGYLGRPELTAERFVPDPWAGAGSEAGARLYRSGDLGRRLWDGDIEYLGRIDHQVKIRGFRIELGEIEAALSAHPETRECVVLARQDAPGDTRLVAYLVPEEPGRWSEDALREHLKKSLPEHMLPAVYVLLEALPLTPNGKVDRKALPAPDAERSADVLGYVAPRDPTEEILVGIWQEVLGRERVGVRDDFFALGGHSLLATQVVSRVRGVFQVELPVRRLFETPTVEALARGVETARQGEARLQAPPMVPVSRQGPLPLSFAQQRLWFVDQLEPGNPAYNVPWAVALDGDLAVEPLRRTFEEVVRRHEALRTTFALSRQGARGAVQEIAPAPAVPLPVVSLAALPATTRRGEARRLGMEEAGHRFDLRSGPLLRVLLVRLAEREHILLGTVHHIVSDGWSVGVMLREITVLYGAFLRREPSPLAALPVQYADFAVWQREWLSGEVLAAQLAYWRERLSGAPRRLDLATDRPRPLVPSFRGGVLPLALGATLSRQLAALSRREGVTPFMTLLAAFGVLLGRSAQQEDLLVGTPVANRTREETEGLIGFFVNTLVLRIELSGAVSFRALLARVRQSALGAFTHQDLPFERLVDELDPDRDPRQAPLFQVMFALQNAAAGRLDLPGLVSRAVDAPTRTAKFDLTLALQAGEEEISGAVEYSSDLFDRATVERTIARLERLLGAIVEGMDRPLADLPLLAPGEREQLLAWGGARESHPAGETLAALFEAQVRRSPGARAVTCEGRELTYGELNRRANRLAWRLREQGVGPEERVGLAVERSLDLVIGVLGIVKAGGAYVPLDPGYPAERRAFIAGDSGVRVIVGSEEDLTRYPETDPPVLGSEGSLAYVIYTSGSTGRPKGVLVTHGNVVRLFRATAPWFGFGAEDVWTLFHSYAFDFSVWEIWGALLHGGRLVVVPYAVSRTPQAFHDLLEAERVTVLNQTPSAFTQLMRVEEEKEEPARAGRLADLRLVIFGGEALEPWRLAPWFQRRSPGGDERPRLVNMYGITETTVHVTYRPLAVEDARPGRGSVLGIPIPDLSVYAVDPGGALSPVGIPGELVIGGVGGAGLARGYLGRPDLSAERFVPDPLSGEPGARLYRSGDLGRYLPTGELEYLGRIDHQVKIRGFRIELDEIQVALAEHPGVREAIVLAREEEGGERRLIAYVVPREEQRPAASELRDRLESRLPEYMVPAAFVLLDALPLTENGKVDRKALLALSTFQRQEEATYTAPRNESESALAEIYEQVLGIAPVGIDDRFFSLGGDSILSLRVRALAEERGLHFSLQQLLEHQSVRELARHLEAVSEPLAAVVEPFGLLAPSDRAALPQGVEDAYPLTALQTGMLYHSVYTAESALYHNVSSLRLTGPWDPAALEGAVAALLARHPVLRTAFDLSHYGEPLQLVYSRIETPLVVADLRGVPGEEQDRLLTEVFAAEQRQRFDLAVAPLLRFQAHLLGENLFQLTWTEHHAILDGWSVASMLAELFELYQRQRRQPAAGDAELLPLPPLQALPAVRFRDFVALERRLVAGEDGKRYWLEQLEGAPRTALPRRSAAPAGDSVAPRMEEVASFLPVELTARARQLARSAGVPLKSVLLAVHFRVLALMTGQRDLVSGLVVNGRPEVEGGERILGLFLNTLPLRLRLAGGSWLDLVRQAFAAERGLLPFRRYPMAELQQGAGGGALFETVFNFVHFHVLERVEESEARVLADRSFAQTNFPFTASFSLVGGGSRLHLRLEFDESLHGREQVEGIAGRYLRVLEELTAEPETRLDARSFLAEPERQALLAEWNDSAAPYPALGLHEIFDRQAAARPTALAVVGERTLTYGELRREANRLAHHLRSLGVGPEVRVGLLLERSPDLLVAVLGILKAGGAYVPMPADDPERRLALVAGDSRMALVVTRSELRPRLPAGLPAVLLDLDREAIEARSAENPPYGTGPADLAYVLYTSGSTGVPKGVMVPHRGAVNYLAWAIGAYGLGLGRRSLLHSSIGFDLTVTALLGPLLSGGEVHLVPEAEGVEGLVRALMATPAEPVQMLKLTPAHLEVLRRELPAEFADRARVLVLGGEALSGDALDLWKRAAPATLVVNEYGPTEATVGCSVQVAPASAIGSGPVPIGRPIANARLHVLSSELELLPPGARGELFLGGDGLARGYLGRPDLTAERFLPDPYAELPGERLYRTGDLARRQPDGVLEFLGREDHQVKIRGVRVELGEIEAALLRHPQVLEAVVEAREEAAGERSLAAYLVAAEPRPAVAELRRFLRGELLALVVPAAFVFLDALPLTANGKVDRRALPAPERLRPDLGRGYLAPRDALELALARVWEGVLAVRPIGIADDFFELGGHSLLAVQLMARIERDLGVRLPMATLLRQPTVERLAAVLRGEVGPLRRPALVEIEIEPGRDGASRPLFLVHPIGGDVLCYVHLARQLAGERAVYGLQTPDPDPVTGEPLASVEAMAAHYIESLRTVQPAGPYSLGGWSMGGVVAFEMARQLGAQGETVDRLVLLDSRAPAAGGEDRPAVEGGELVAAFAYDLARLFGLGLFTLPAGFGDLPAEEALRRLAAEAKRLDLLPAGLEGEELERRFAVFQTNFRAIERYAGGACPAPLVLLRAAETAGSTAEPEDLGWGRLLGRPIEVHTVPGDHYSLLARSQAEPLASLWRGAGDRLETAADPPLTNTPA